MSSTIVCYVWSIGNTVAYACIQVQDMYFADPPEQPDLEFCKDAVRMLIKYNDR